MGDPQIGNVFYWGGSPTEVTVLSPASGASAEGLILRGGARRAFGFEGQESLRAGAPQGWRNGDSALGGHSQVFTCTESQPKAATPEQPGLNYWWVVEDLLGRQRSPVAHAGSKDTGSRRSREYSLG